MAQPTLKEQIQTVLNSPMFMGHNELLERLIPLRKNSINLLNTLYTFILKSNVLGVTLNQALIAIQFNDETKEIELEIRQLKGDLVIPSNWTNITIKQSLLVAMLNVNSSVVLDDYFVLASMIKKGYNYPSKIILNNIDSLSKNTLKSINRTYILECIANNYIELSNEQEYLTLLKEVKRDKRNEINYDALSHIVQYMDNTYGTFQISDYNIDLLNSIHEYRVYSQSESKASRYSQNYNRITNTEKGIINTLLERL